MAASVLFVSSLVWFVRSSGSFASCWLAFRWFKRPEISGGRLWEGKWLLVQAAHRVSWQTAEDISFRTLFQIFSIGMLN